MAAIIFNGKTEAAQRQTALRDQVQRLSHAPVIASVFFTEDESSVLYTRVKKQAALSCGIGFEEYEFQIKDANLTKPLAKIKELIKNPTITGVIVQKPMQNVWQNVYQGSLAFDEWWHELAAAVPPFKDVDGLSPATLQGIKQGEWTILPATVKAILITLESALGDVALTQAAMHPETKLPRTAIVGCSDIIGLPLADVLVHHGASVQLICDHVTKEHLENVEIVVSATGIPNIIAGDIVGENIIAIDVGAPKADFYFDSVLPKARFITPVPGGIGPLTVTCLLENAVQLATAETLVTV